MLPWPPEGAYTTPWTPGIENYIFLSYGYADAAHWGDVGGGTWYNEVKTTSNSLPELYAVQTGIPSGEDRTTLQAVRVEQTFLLLRRHGPEQPWIIENRFDRAEMPATLQVGITAYTDWNSVSAINEFHHNRTVNPGGNPDLVADVDYYRLRRPNPALIEAMLAAAPITGQGGALQNLIATALEPHLGDNALTPPTTAEETYDDWLRATLTPAQLVLPSYTNPTADPDGDGHNNLLEYALGTHPNDAACIERPTMHLDGDTLTLTYPRMRGNLEYLVQSSTDLVEWVTTDINQDLTSSLGQPATATLIVPPDIDRTFLRLRVVVP